MDVSHDVSHNVIHNVSHNVSRNVSHSVSYNVRCPNLLLVSIPTEGGAVYDFIVMSSSLVKTQEHANDIAKVIFETLGPLSKRNSWLIVLILTIDYWLEVLGGSTRKKEQSDSTLNDKGSSIAVES